MTCLCVPMTLPCPINEKPYDSSMPDQWEALRWGSEQSRVHHVGKCAPSGAIGVQTCIQTTREIDAWRHAQTQTIEAGLGQRVRTLMERAYMRWAASNRVRRYCWKARPAPHVCIHLDAYVWGIFMYVWMYVCMHVCIYVWIFYMLCVYVCDLYVWSVCMYAVRYTCTHIHTYVEYVCTICTYVCYVNYMRMYLCLHWYI